MINDWFTNQDYPQMSIPIAPRVNQTRSMTIYSVFIY